VAMADPDSKRAEKTFAAYPKVPKYTDYRKMLDKEGGTIDAVTVSCPDHMHGSAAMWAMERGKHVYCQKPLTRTVWEAQQLTLAAAKYGVATQMGNQGYSQPGAREAAEIIWRGAIGDMACHIMGTPNMAMRLTAPTTVECIKLEGKAKYTFPYRTAIRFDFPARGAMPPVKVFWYDRMEAVPKFDGVPEGELIG